MKTHALGKGLSALIPKESPAPTEQRQIVPPGDAEATDSTRLIELMKVRPNRFQPRHDFDPVALAELVDSIKEKGVIQPITVRRIPGGFELVAGERRVRASIEAGLEKIPAYVLDIVSDADMLELAIIENVQRENLNPIEVALGYQRLIDECELTQEEVAVKVGKERSTVTNFLRLLKLTPLVQESLRLKNISMGHARSMLALSTAALQESVLHEVEKKELSVRATEALVKDVVNGKVAYDGDARVHANGKSSKEKNAKPSKVTSTLTDIESHLRTLMGTQVRVRTKNEAGAGSIELEFYSFEDLERLLELFAVVEQSVMQ